MPEVWRHQLLWWASATFLQLTNKPTNHQRGSGDLVLAFEDEVAEQSKPGFRFEKRHFQFKSWVFNRFERPLRRFGGNRVASERQMYLKKVVFGDLSKSALQG